MKMYSFPEELNEGSTYVALIKNKNKTNHGVT